MLTDWIIVVLKQHRTTDSSPISFLLMEPQNIWPWSPNWTLNASTIGNQGILYPFWWQMNLMKNNWPSGGVSELRPRQPTTFLWELFLEMLMVRSTITISTAWLTLHLQQRGNSCRISIARQLTSLKTKITIITIPLYVYHQNRSLDVCKSSFNGWKKYVIT